MDWWLLIQCGARQEEVVADLIQFYSYWYWLTFRGEYSELRMRIPFITDTILKHWNHIRFNKELFSEIIELQYPLDVILPLKYPFVILARVECERSDVVSGPMLTNSLIVVMGKYHWDGRDRVTILVELHWPPPIPPGDQYSHHCIPMGSVLIYPHPLILFKLHCGLRLSKFHVHFYFYLILLRTTNS